MKNITFLIGNGFDINVGLDTRYSDFYEYCKERNAGDKIVTDIGKNTDLWSDLEIGLGKYTAKVNKGEEEEFWNSEALLEESLADYLEGQQNRIYIPDDEETEIATKMRDSLVGFYKNFPKEQQQYLVNRMSSLPGDISYSFICFNYTDALDRCVSLVKKHFSKDISNHRYSGTTYTHSLGNILHIHGTLNAEMILGVNDIEQIANQEFRNNISFRELLIKEYTNKRFAQNKIQDMREIIDNSIIICVFGMSIGATDKMWWEYICQWLQKGDLRRLIIYVKGTKQKRIMKHQLFASQNEMLERIQSNSGMKDSEWGKIEEKIFVNYGDDIFNFRIVKDITN